MFACMHVCGITCMHARERAHAHTDKDTDTDTQTHTRNLGVHMSKGSLAQVVTVPFHFLLQRIHLGVV